MKILLDENFPLQLVRSLREKGRDVEHIILLGQRGCSDAVIGARLDSEATLFLTHDQEFLDLPLTQSTIIVSRVTQTLPIVQRVSTWVAAIDEFFSRAWSERIFEVFDDGKLCPWEVRRT